MTSLNLLLVLGSACLHVVLHVALKRARQRAAFTWWALLWSVVLYAPVSVLGWQPLPALAWGVMALSALFEALYFYAIALAYEHGDLSTVYPLARGTAPVLLLVWSRLLLREPLTSGGMLGVLVIALGLYLVNLPSLGAWRTPLAALRAPGSRWALVAGLSISAYTALDRVGVRLAPPLLYTHLALVLTLVLLTPLSLRQVGRDGLWREWRAAGWRSALGGFTMLSAYAIVLGVMASGAPAGYVGAVREVSVVLGAAIGVLFLGERGGTPRLLGAGLVAAGVGVIALLG